MTAGTTRALRAAAFAAVLGASLILSQARARVAAGHPALTVPRGFEVERVAQPPLVERPMTADFDEEGRLYVADSSGSNAKVEQQLAERPHRIVRLEDTDGDGRFDTSHVFADRMMLPEGTLWFDGSLYVAAPPSIWKLTDTDGDGTADRREEWFAGRTLTGCANDLHGPYLGPDGWIYWTKGGFAEQTYERPGRPPLVTRAAHVFRRRPGDAVVEPVITGGMDNPVDVAFTPSGDALLTATFLEHPQLGRRDGIVHAVYGGVYGKPHAVIDAHPRTGGLMPLLSELGPAVPSGLTRYASRAFGDDYRDNFFAAMFNLHKVTRHAIEPSGATFASRDSDFVVSDNPDFHPTDVLEDADGSLLVIDTGAWYKLCCPTSQLAKPDVPGGIYRVRRRGAPALPDPRGRAIAWRALPAERLVALLDDGRPAVRSRAVQQLAALGSGAITAIEGALRSSQSAELRRNAVWALTRMESPQAREASRPALRDPDAGVRRAALHAAGLWRDRTAAPQLREALASRLPAEVRAAAEALGRLGDAAAVPGLLAAATGRADRTLTHSLIYALIEIADPVGTAAGLSASSPHVRRAALVALDQMPGGRLQPETVIALLDSRDPVLSETAWWIAGHHPEWGEALAGYFAPRLAAGRLKEAEREDLERQLARFGASEGVQRLLAAAVERPASVDARAIALRAMTRVRAKTLPAAWLAPLSRVLAGSDAEAVRLALSVARAAPAAPDAAATLRSALLHVARDSARPADVRLDALASLDGGPGRLDADLWQLLRASLGTGQAAGVRMTAAALLAKAELSPDQLLGLTAIVETAGPLELPRLLPAFDRGNDEALGLALLAALERAASRSSVRADVLRPRLAAYPASVRARGEALLERLNADAVRQARRLDQLLAVLRDGDVRRGQTLFNGSKAACATCHAIGYRGGTLGPDLTAIGQIRSERDLLEAILFPNASFARGYESVVVTTTSGDVHSGLLRRELADEVVVAVSEREETRIPKERIADMQPGTASVMPLGYGDLLTRQELADLLAFLKGTRWGAD